MSRWKVRQSPLLYWDEDDEEYRWDNIWRVVTPSGKMLPGFSTHAEAMAVADKESRTVTVTLPRTGKRVELGRQGTHLRLHPAGGAALHSDYGCIGIRKTDLERVALALLAHARRSA